MNNKITIICKRFAGWLASRFMKATDDSKSVSLLSLAMEKRFAYGTLSAFAQSALGIVDETNHVDALIRKIVGTRQWDTILDGLQIDDFRVCTKCGSLMHDGYCLCMGAAYYCSDRCLRMDFSRKAWEKECESDDQTYWTVWFEDYELINSLKGCVNEQLV